MRKLFTTVALSAVLLGSVSCAYMPGGTNLSEVATSAGMVNVTTGDGTFENYQATGHYTGMEIGLAVGIPYLMKLIEIFPMQSNEALLGKVAESAKADGANAMINVAPHKEFYTGIPFLFFGIYVDSAEGTGIKAK